MAADTTSTAIPGQARNPQINQWLASLQPALLIGNQRVPARSGNTFETINPATGKVLATVAEGDASRRRGGRAGRAVRVRTGTVVADGPGRPRRAPAPVRHAHG